MKYANNNLASLLFPGTFANRVAGEPLFLKDLSLVLTIRSSDQCCELTQMTNRFRSVLRLCWSGL
jgi:hypothetical protein